MTNPDALKMRNLDWLYRSKSQNRFLGIMILKFLFFVFGILAIFSELLGNYSAPILIVLYVVMEITSWSYNKARQIWESFHRELELNESLGLPITKYIDVLPLLSNKERELVENGNAYSGTYFANTEVGVEKSIKNTLESSWWSKHLSQVSSRIYMAITICIGTISLIAVFYSIQYLNDTKDMQTAAKVVVSFIFMIFSMDFIKLWHGYHIFQVDSEKIENKCRDYLVHGCQDIMKAYALWVEYQFSRSQAPLVPQTVWKLKQKNLNQVWQSLK